MKQRTRKEYVLKRTVHVQRPLLEVFEFFAAAENLERLTPPELGFQILSHPSQEMKTGTLIEYRIKLHGLPMKWLTEITGWDPPHSFEDTQLRGPYAKWVHTHTFTAEEGGTRVDDRVVYALPLDPLGRIAHPIIARQLRRIFEYRGSVMREIFG
ncbi:MAG: SRPBCC family protein [Gemmatimonadaceae bacterium]